MDINGAVRDVHILSPNLFQEFIASHNFAGSLHQQRQDLKFLIGDFDGSFAFEHFTPLGMDSDHAALNRIAAFFRFGPSQHRANAAQ